MKPNKQLFDFIEVYDTSVQMERLIKEAVAISEDRNNALKTRNKNPRSIVMSVSEKKVRP